MPDSVFRSGSRLVAAVFCLAGVVTVAAAAGAPAAQTAPPNSYYGTVESSTGTAAPVGTEIVAVANGEVQDSIVVETAGEYGGSSSTAEKLRVSSDVDSTVTFHIGGPNGTQADESDQNPEGDVEQLNLTFPGGTFGGPTPTPTPTETPTETPATSTPTPDTPTETPTPTDDRTPDPATEEPTPTETETAAPPGTARDSGETSSSGAISDSTDTGDDGRTTAVGTATANRGEPRGATRSTATDARTTTPTAQVATDGVAVTNASVNRTRVQPNGTVRVDATVRNGRPRLQTAPVPLVADGETIRVQDVTVAGNATETVRFRYSPSRPGNVSLRVGRVSAGNIVVRDAGGGPWGLLQTIVTALAGLVVSVYLILKALAIYLGY